MKKIVVSLFALVLTIGAFAQTQNKATPQQKKEWMQKGKENRQDKMENLNLTDNQKAQMKTINEGFRTKMQSVMQDNSLSQEAKKEKRMELTKAHRTQVESILTDEQKKTLKEDRKKVVGEGRKNSDRKLVKGDNRKAKGDKFEKAKEDMDFTADQTNKMKAINTDFRNNVKTLKSNTALTEAQKKEQMQVLQKNHKEAIAKVLTPEQQNKMKNHHKERKGRGKADRITK